jgi:hypothetical protein
MKPIIIIPESCIPEKLVISGMTGGKSFNLQQWYIKLLIIQMSMNNKTKSISILQPLILN